jgi:hypothetical protein
VFSPPDYVLFAREGTLMARRLDFTTLQPAGDPQAVAGRVAKDGTVPGSLAVSASAEGRWRTERAVWSGN